MSFHLEIRDTPSEKDSRDWGPTIIKLTASDLDTPLYYITHGDSFYGKRYLKFTKTVPTEWEAATVVAMDSGKANYALSTAKLDIMNEIYDFEKYRHDKYLHSEFPETYPPPDMDTPEMLNAKPFIADEYKYLYSAVFLSSR